MRKSFLRGFAAAVVALGLIAAGTYGNPLYKLASSGAVARTIEAILIDSDISVLWFGAVADAKSCNTSVISITAGTNVLTTDANCAFSSADVGKTIAVQGAGISGASDVYGAIAGVAVTSGGTYTALPNVYFTNTGSTNKGVYSIGGADAVGSVFGGANGATLVSGGAGGPASATVTLTVVGGPSGSTPATVTGTTNGAGVLTAITGIASAGSYQAAVPTGTLSLSGSTFTTAPTATLTWTIQSIAILHGGNGYNKLGTTAALAQPSGSATVAAVLGAITFAGTQQPLITTIAGYTNPQSITLAANATTTVAGIVPVEWGTDNLPAFNNAILASYVAFGRCILAPSGGAPYLVNGQINLEAYNTAVCLHGSPTTLNFTTHGTNAPNAEIATQGTWIEGIDPHFATVFAKNGAVIRDVDFLTADTVPSTGWAGPVIRPYRIEAASGFVTLEHVGIFNGTHGVLVAGSVCCGGGTADVLNDLRIGSSRYGLSGHNLNNTLNISKVEIVPYWYNTTAAMVADREANFIGMNLDRMDNAAVDSVEVYQAAVAFAFSNGVASGTSSLGTVITRWSNIDCNESIVCAQVADASTNLTGMWTNFTAHVDQANAGTAPLFQFGAENVNLHLANFRLEQTLGAVFVIGDGNVAASNHAFVAIDSGEIDGWGNGAMATVNAGAILSLGAVNIARTAGGSNATALTSTGAGTLIYQTPIVPEHLVPASGTSHVIPDGITWSDLQPAATLASFGETLPHCLTDGQELRISSSQPITAMAIAAASGQTVQNAPTALAAGGSATFRCGSASATWIATMVSGGSSGGGAVMTGTTNGIGRPDNVSVVVNAGVISAVDFVQPGRSSPVTLQATDNGTTIPLNSGASSVTIPAGVGTTFLAPQITICFENNTSASVPINNTSGAQMYPAFTGLGIGETLCLTGGSDANSMFASLGVAPIVSVPRGGTGVASFPAGAIPVGAGANPLGQSGLSDTGTTIAATNRQTVSTPLTLTPGATVAVNAQGSDNFNITLNSNSTFNFPTGLIDGQNITFKITQGSPGGFGITWANGYNWASGAAAPLNSAAGALTLISCRGTSTTSATCYGGPPVPSYQPFSCTLPVATTTGASTLFCMQKAPRALTVVSIMATASGTFGSVTASILECGTSATCSGAVTIGSGAVSAANTGTPITVSSAVINSGDYFAVELSAATSLTSVAMGVQIEMQ